MLYETSIDNSAWCWIRVGVVILLNETSVDLLVDQTIEDLGVVVCLSRLDCAGDSWLLIFDHFFLVAGTTDTVAVNRNLSGKNLIELTVLLKGFLKEIRKNLCSVGTNSLLLLIFSQ